MNMINKPKRLSQKVAASNKWIKIIHEDFEFSSGNQGEFLIVEREPAVMIIPVIEDEGEIYTYLVKQYRYPIDEDVWQFPMGSYEKGNDMKSHALEELRQETGLIAKTVQKQGEYYVDPGLSRQKCIVYIATDIIEGGEQDLEESEKGMIAKKFSVKEFNELVNSGSINDSWAYSGLHFLLQYLSR